MPEHQPKSRAGAFTPAIRERAFARLFLSGPGGSGKTRTALRIADELIATGAAVGPVAMIDTEHRTGLLYADRHQFIHLDWTPPYDPRDLAATIDQQSKDQPGSVLIIDSATHFWAGKGGTLQIVDAAAPRRGSGRDDKFAGWNVGTPAQQSLTEAIQAANLHVICCARAKIGYEVVSVPVTDSRGQPALNDGVPIMRNQVRKLGMEPVQRDDFDYDMGVCVNVGMDHALTITKTRADALPIGQTFGPDEDQAFARIYGVWLQEGEKLADPDRVAAVVAALDDIEPATRRTQIKGEFVHRFGFPQRLPLARLEDAAAWVAKIVGDVAPRQFAPAEPPAEGNPTADGQPDTDPSADQPPPAGEPDSLEAVMARLMTERPKDVEREIKAVLSLTMRSVDAQLRGLQQPTDGDPAVRKSRLVAARLTVPVAQAS